MEAYSNSLGGVIDEDLSISGLFNNQVYQRNRSRAAELIQNGVIDPRDFENQAGKFDFNKLARHLKKDKDSPYKDYILTDLEAKRERAEMLRKRREERAAVLAAGPGSAQFAGMMTGFTFFEPANVATMGISTIPNLARGMTVTALAMRSAGRTAALTAGTEALIQPFVYAHKDDIDSPYSVNNALLSIGAAGAGGAAVGLVTGGLAGFINKFRQAAADSLSPVPKADGDDVEQLSPFLADQEDTISSIENVAEVKLPRTEARDLSSVDRGLRDAQELLEALDEANPPSVARLIDEEYQKYQQKQYQSDLDAGNALIKKLYSQLREANNSPTVMAAIKKRGGLNRQSFVAEGLDPADLKKGFPVGFWKKDGMGPDELAEFLVESQDILPGYINRAGGPNGFSVNESVDLVSQLSQNPKMFIDPDVQIRIDELEGKISELEIEFADPTRALTGDLKKAVTFARRKGKPFTTSSLQKHLRIGYNPTREIIQDLKSKGIFAEDDGLNVSLKPSVTISPRSLEDIYQESSQLRITEDVERLAELEAHRLSSYQPSRAFEDYYQEFPDLPAAPVVSSRERELMEIADIGDGYDEAIAAYEKLAPEDRVVKVDGEVIYDAPAVIKELDENLESAEALRRCVRGE